MTLGITDGTQKVGIASDSSAILKTFTSLYGVEVGTANPSGAVSAYSGLGTNSSFYQSISMTEMALGMPLVIVLRNLKRPMPKSASLNTLPYPNN